MVTHPSPHLGPENQDVLGAASHGATGTGWLEGGGWVAVERDVKGRPLLRTGRQTMWPKTSPHLSRARGALTGWAPVQSRSGAGLGHAVAF